ncbi:sugar kinase [Microbacterium protaetiae]|uniref:sugar kinase n=1 Tax=Microbacterium protaetiae TaxID=2509458 RepID=UPI001F5CA9C1|nr:sugar kinase [Microbacterium protaetiae]
MLLAVGETMALVAPAVAGRVVDAELFRLDAGGAESNVAAHVAALGQQARWFSRLGTDPLGDRVARQLAMRGVQLDGVIRDPDHPTGLYVKDPGNGVRYYRAGSAASHLTPADVDAVDWTDVEVLHISGITAILSPSAAAFLDALIARARSRDVAVSFDVNHRAALWDAATAAPTLAALARQADIVFVGRDEAEGLWGTPTAEATRALLGEVPELVVKDGDVGATVFVDDEVVFEPAHRVEVVDVVGAGDAFAGGYLAALLGGADHGARLRAGHERAALTLTTTGDSIIEEVPVIR